MTDYDPEAAFLASLGGDQNYGQPQTYQQPQAEEEEDEEEEEEEEQDDDDYDPSSFMPDTTQPPSSYNPTPQPSVAAHQAPVNIPTDTARGSASASITSQPPSQAPSRTASRISDQQNIVPQQGQKQRTIGGFIEEDDDEDETPVQLQQAATANGTLAVSSTNTPSLAAERSVAQTPTQTLPQVHNQPDMGASDVVPNGATSTSPAFSSSQTGVAVSAEGKAVGAASSQLHQAPSQSNPSSASAAPVSKARLPHDVVGQWEDRIKEDPRGDLDAWLDLVEHYRSRSKFDDARKVYDRFFKVFPTAAEQWLEYANMENGLEELQRLQDIFNTALMNNYSVPFWQLYINFIQRRFNLTVAPQDRPTVQKAWEFALDRVGIDKDAGDVWQDYISFLKSAPGNVGGSGWQDAQKMDLLRKGYQRAICVPTQAVTSLWKDYDKFEMDLNKTTGRKFLQEKSPAYMTARSSYTALQNITKDLKRTTLPTLPPAPGFDGDEEYQKQIDIWKKWISWEKEDPLVLKDEDKAAYHERILYAYRQAMMALRFWPPMWFDAAEFCFENGLTKEGDEFLERGIEANPESCLLAFKQADRIEQKGSMGEGEEGLKKRGDAVRKPLDGLLQALYGLVDKAKQRETQAIARIDEHFANLSPESREPTPAADDEDDEDQTEGPKLNSREAEKKRQVDEVRRHTGAQIQLLSKTISHTWIAVMRAMRRIQGQGSSKPDAVVGGMRAIVQEARKRGRITGDFYIAAALMEHHCYNDPIAIKIFERGIRLYPEDESFALEYLKHLIAVNDITNARAVFETSVSKLTSKPENIPRAAPLFIFFHEYESQFGELAQIAKLEKRMADLYPTDPSLTRFAHRYTSMRFDPCTTRIIVSPTTQTRPKTKTEATPDVESAATLTAGPTAAAATAAGYVPSPKRPLDDSDAEAGQPLRKFARGESPLKGAAGRRQQQARRAAEGDDRGDGVGFVQESRPQRPRAKPLPRAIWDMLHNIPHARTYNSVFIDPERVMQLMRGIDLSRARDSRMGGGYY